MLKNLLNERYEEMVNELMELDTILENRFETIVAIGDEYVETIDVKKISERFNELYYKVRRLDRILNK